VAVGETALEAPAQPTLPTPLSMLQVEALAIGPYERVEVWPEFIGFGLAENAGDVGHKGAGGGGGTLFEMVTETIFE
jgi:hypothetical protein